ncbi:MAG: hypothetical protein IPI91_04090 [Flavobacteriales bacterium]|nr:hypothetical protein [Flavobacteriales bacterium]
MFRSLLFAILVLPVALSAQTSADELLAKATNAYAAETYDLAQAYADSAIALNGELPGAHKLRGDIKAAPEKFARCLAGLCHRRETG